MAYLGAIGANGTPCFGGTPAVLPASGGASIGNVKLGLVGETTVPLLAGTSSGQNSDWPISLPAPSYEGYSLNPVDPSIRTDVEGGAQRVRRRTTARNDGLSLSWLFTDDQMTIFRNWFDNQTNGGAAWFYMGIADGYGGITTQEIRFKGTWKSNLMPGMLWNVTAEIEVR